VLSKSSCVWIAVLLLVACGDRRAKPDAAPVQVATIEEKPVTAEEIEELAVKVERDCKGAPRRADPRFARVNDARNVAWLSDAATPVAERIPRAATWIGASARLLKAYMRCGHPAEFLETSAYMLETQGALAPVFDELLASIPPDDPTRKNREAGRVEMIGGQTEMIRGATLVLRDFASRDRTAAREIGTRLGAATAGLKRNGPPIEGAIDSVRKLVEDEQDVTRRAVLQAMLDAATAPAPAP
jgi:hypothetical protein